MLPNMVAKGYVLQNLKEGIQIFAEKFNEVKLFLIGLEFIKHDSTKIKSNFRRQTIERVIAVKIGKDKLPS